MYNSNLTEKKITLFYRAKGVDFSIENVFDSVIKKIENDFSIQKVHVKYNIITFTNIFNNLIYYKKHLSEVNHITGVIHYCALISPYSRTIITIHDLITLEYGKGLKKYFFWFFFFYLPIKKCKYVTCISNSVKDSLIKFKCCPESKIIVIPNSISDSFVFKPKIFNEKLPRILHIGTRPNKNLQNVIKALKNISCHLIIIGEMRNIDIDLLKEYNIYYTNKKNLTNDEILTEYIECDIVSFPSLYEGFGVPIIEGQAIGRPVLTSNISPMKEVAGENYYLINPHDVNDISQGFKNIIQNTELRNNLISNGLTNAKKYNSKIVANSYLDLYQRVMKEE